ncbi:MAG: pyrroline-5-carboxylate reductase [Alphaproteobacteria bacterium CG_4_9_14_3_um_filter_47_13]|nr:MAG: pyrroline-5-carboxylate reductase [Alphaproteobacteria bacterium CG_4_9_14_3_um_filter_47_13]
MKQHLDIALIGCGKMGSAMLRGWLAARIVNRIYVLDPAGLPEEFKEYAPNPLTYFKDTGSFTEEKPQADLYIIAVKPQIMNEVCRAIAPAVSKNAVVLSIAAGQKISVFESFFGAGCAVIRAMPNTPAAIGKGISVAVANGFVNEIQKEQASTILRSVGQVAWVEDEDLLDAVTALSGSGPAYVFYLIEALAKAGEKAGLDPGFSMKLARQTIIGSAALAEAQPELSAAVLRENVTSPGGTTQAALDILMSEKFQDILNETIKAATTRSRELSQ